MHFSLVSELMIWGDSEHLLTLSNYLWFQSISEPQNPHLDPFRSKIGHKIPKLWIFASLYSIESIDWLPCQTQVRSKSITLVFFDQFSIKKGLDGGFWGSEIDWSQLQFENPIKNMEKSEKIKFFD